MQDRRKPGTPKAGEAAGKRTQNRPAAAISSDKAGGMEGASGAFRRKLVGGTGALPGRSVMQDKKNNDPARVGFLDLGEDRPVRAAPAASDKPGPGKAARAAPGVSAGKMPPRKDGAATPPPRPAAATPAGRASANVNAAAGKDEGGMSFALMLGVFAFSALLGGGVAALWLAMQEKGEVQQAASRPGLSIAMPVRSEQATAGAASSAQTEITPSRASGAAVEKGVTTAVERKGDASAAKQAEELLKTLARAQQPSPPSSKPAEQVERADAAGLRQLTEQVVAALGAMHASADADAATAEAGAERLRASLADLVNAALAQGKSQEEIGAIVAEALESAGEDNIPAMLRDASGKLDVHRLLASVMASMDAAEVPMDSSERAYFDQLREEAASVGGERAAAQKGTRKKKEKGRFFRKNGKLYTIVRRGDTLGKIAYAAYGDMLAYPIILRANRGRISLRKLKPGAHIVIPEIKPRKRAKVRGKARRNGAARVRDTGTRKSAATRKQKEEATTTATKRRARAARKHAKVARDEERTANPKIITLPTSASPGGVGKKQVAPIKTMNFTTSRKGATRLIRPPATKSPLLTGTTSEPAQ